MLPSFRAAASLCFVRSRSMARSNSANAPTICIIMRPAGVVVSMASVRLWKPAPACRIFPIKVQTSFNDRHRRSSFRQGFSALYQRVPRLTETLRIAHADCSFGRLLAQLARIDALILECGMTPLDLVARHDLLEVIDDRSTNKSTIITSQLPIDHWHAWLNDSTVADAILDRLGHRFHRITLKSDSVRQKTTLKARIG